MVRSGIIVAFFTLISRLFGLVREFFIAYLFGTSGIADCVNIAFRFPNLFRRIFGEGAVSSVFVPIFSKKLVGSTQEAKIFSGKVITLLGLFLVLLTLMIEIFMPQLMLILIPGFYQDTEKFTLAVDLCRITTPYMIALSLVAVFGGMLNSVGRFSALAFAPVIMSVSIVIFTYYFDEKYTAHYSIAYSLIIAGILQLGFMLICLKKAELIPPISFDLKDKSVFQFLYKLGPAILGSGTQQLNLFISQSISSFLPGAISILNYADRLYQLPMSLIGVTFGTILLPELSKLYKSQNFGQIKKLQNISIKIALLISVPASLGLYILAEPIIHVIYQRGEFLYQDTLVTAKILAIFAFGLPAFTLSKVFTPIYYANLDTRTPLVISVYSLLANSVLNVILMQPFGVAGIALGFTISSWFNLWLLYRGVQRFCPVSITHESKIFIIKLLVAALVMCVVTFAGHIFWPKVAFSEYIIIKIGYIFAIILSSIMVFVIMAFILKLHKIIDEYKNC